jgi:4,5-dihydroxyphthalate decarboxylase
MPRPRLTAVSRTQGNNRALKDGTVQLPHFALEFEEVPVLVHAFRRMVRELAYDVCEMAATTYLVAKAHGTPFTAIPVFGVRGFHHGAILRGARSGVGHPKDLEGKAVGVNRGYTVTTGVWARGALRDEYGVDLDSIRWVLSGDEHVKEYRPPANVVPMPAGRTLADLVRTGELAAAIGIDPEPGLVPLIPDADERGYAALRRTGWYPLNHLVVIKDSVLAGHPGLAAEVFEGFAEAKRRYLTGAEPVSGVDRRVMDITGADPLPYGIGPNRAALAALLTHALDQHILAGRPDLDRLFAAGTRDLEG